VTPAAIALADVALSVLGAGNPAGLDTVVEHWTDSGLLPETTPGRHQGAASMEQVQAMLLERVTPRPGPSVPVLFDVGEQEVAGRTGDLRLAVLPGGPPGLYPDPSTMGFHRADAAFARSLGLAWAVAFPGWAGAPCVLTPTPLASPPTTTPKPSR
jgi:hypothetical protein